MVTITKTTPELFFSFMNTVASLQPCTIQKIRQGMKTAMGPVYSAQNFAIQYGFLLLNKETKTFSLSVDGERLMYYSGDLRNKFLSSNIKLQFFEPFASIRNQLSQKTQMTVKEIGDFLNVKFPQKRKWGTQDKVDYGQAAAEWLTLMNVAKRKNGGVEYLGGEVKTAGIIHYHNMGRLLDRALYDFLTENFHTPHNILDEPYELLEKIKETKDDNERGGLFESFIATVFRRFGFSSRLRDGVREESMHLSLTKSGGGDVALFCHFPMQSTKEILHGCAIACEGKATESAIGSKAVGQVRNLCRKIKEAYPSYLVQPLIVSQSICGYDESGRRTAPPEVIHLTSKVLLSLLDIQRKRQEKGDSLIIPNHMMLLFQELMKQQELEPQEKAVAKIMEKCLRT